MLFALRCTCRLEKNLFTQIEKRKDISLNNRTFNFGLFSLSSSQTMKTANNMNQERKCVYLDGFFRCNFGDDLLFYLLCKRYPKITFISYSDYEYQWLERLTGNLIVARPRIKNVEGGVASKAFHMLWIMQNARKCNFFVRLGGSLYIYKPAVSRFLNKIKLQLQRTYAYVTTKMYKKSFVIDSCFGPYGNDKQYYSIVRDTFSRCVDVSLRDKYSKKMFCDIPQVRCNPDLVFSMGPIREKKKKKAVISVVNPWNKKKFSYTEHTCKQYEQALVNCCQKLSNEGYQLQIVSFCEKEGDLYTASRLKDNLRQKGIEVQLIEYQQNLKDIIDILSESELVVASRFHAAVIALCAHCRIVPVIYDEKTRNMLNDIGFPDEQRIEIGINDEHLSDLTMEIVSSDRPFVIDSNVFLHAKRHFDILDKELF